MKDMQEAIKALSIIVPVLIKNFKDGLQWEDALNISGELMPFQTEITDGFQGLDNIPSEFSGPPEEVIVKVAGLCPDIAGLILAIVNAAK
jgi:hypothetical protein